MPARGDVAAAAAAAAAAASKKKKKKAKGKKADDGSGYVDFASPLLDGQAAAPGRQDAYSATAQAQADLLATASDLYRRIEADPQGIPDDDAYWTSLPAHLRTFIRNALPLGQFPPSAQLNPNDPKARQASTQAMIAVAQQLAQAAHASQRHLSQYPPGTHPYPSLPFDPSIFADLALSPEQALPLHPHPNYVPAAGHHYGGTNPPPTQPPGEPLPAPMVLVNEYGEEAGDYDDDYYSDEELDHEHVAMDQGLVQGPDGGWMQDLSGARMANGAATGEQPSGKKKNKKKKKKGGGGGGGGGGAEALPPAALPPATTPAPAARTPAAPPAAVPPAPAAPRTAANPAAPPPSSRAAGKQPMTFSSRAAGKAPATARPAANGHSHAPSTTAAGKRPAAPAAAGAAAPAPSSHGHGSVNGTAAGGAQPPRIWSTSSVEERERIKEFWLGLSERERRSLVKVEKDSVLRKMKEQQKHGCTCSVCTRKRLAIEEELEVLYDSYYDELEQYANHQQQYVSSGGTIPPPPGPGPFPGSVALDSNGAVIDGAGLVKPPPRTTRHAHPPAKRGLPAAEDDGYDDDELDEEEDDYEYDDEEEEEEEDDADLDDPESKTGARRRRAPAAPPAGRDFLSFGSSLTVKGKSVRTRLR
jgi:hypothetical protein